MKTTSLLALATLATTTFASSAHAHIDATLGDATGRNGDMKAVPCDGAAGSGPVFTYEPGATVEIKVNEWIPHPGYFRIAFDAEGKDNFMEPRSIKPLDPGRACPFDDFDKCTESDFCNNEAVLWDNLAPHTSSLFATYSFKIKLPDVECEKCSMQVIQVMEDTIHGGYCPLDLPGCKDDPRYVEDNYHRCFDIKLKKGATNGAGGSKDAVSLPADKKYIDCKAEGGNPPKDPGSDPETRDGGTTPVDPGESDDDPATDNSDDDDTQGETGAKQDGGTKQDAGTKKDASASIRKDAGKDTDEPTASSSDDGCALAGSTSEGAAWSLLALGLMLARRRRC